MCGIAGVYYSRSHRPADQEQLGRMCGAIRHRGPDDQSVYCDGDLGLGMRRLSIIDLAGGRQPVFNEDGTIAVVFNGEIYNFQDLRSQLASQGHIFRTRSDTEVIVHAYEEWGDDFVTRLNGMFAIALWDSGRRRLWLIRDRLGVKPLYYAWTRDGLVFGSELKCLLHDDGVECELDHAAVYHYFSLKYIPHPFTIYRAVRQLPPGCMLLVDGDSLHMRRYWTLTSQVDATQDKQEVIERLQELTADAVRIRMISDVPLGAFLSGGLDSSIVVALMAQASPAPVKTFHIDFGEPEESEQRFARAVADRYGTNHEELVVRPDAVGILDQLVEAFDEPFGDSSAIPTYSVSQLTRRHVTVALAGDGGDESFGGYTHYRQVLKSRSGSTFIRRGLGAVGGVIHRVLPRTAPGRQYFRGLGMEDWRHFTVGVSELETRDLLTPDFLSTLDGVSTFDLLRQRLVSADNSDPLAPYACVDVEHYLPDDILVKVDRMSMAHSLEVRGPFLDYRIVELAATMPASWKIRNGESKVILKEAFGHLLPPEVLQPRKRGFSIPLARWFRTDLKEMLADAIEDSAVQATGIFNQTELRGLFREHLSGHRNRASQLWRFLFFARWWHSHSRDLDGRGAPTGLSVLTVPAHQFPDAVGAEAP